MSKKSRIAIELESGERREIPATGGKRSLADELAAHGLPLNTRCGQRGLCRGCEVELIEGSVMADGVPVTAPATIRACRARGTGSTSIRIPARSRIEHRPQVSETFEISVPCAHRPLFPPTTGGRDTAFAVDVGTTTVVVLLIDIPTGEVLSRAGAFNEQIRFGDNVLTRIEAARERECLMAMQKSVVTETIAPLLLRACERAGRGVEQIAGGAVAGNTTMLHLLVGEDPTSMGVAPFTPRFIEAKQVAVREIGLVSAGLDPQTPVMLLPGIAAYIGADITAGVFATGMLYDPAPSLLVDIGTNGEIVLQTAGQLTACATAAGPAFEGSGLCCGTRAREGALSGLQIGLDPFRINAKTIGDVPLSRANGLCGSAYIDFIASGHASGLLGPTGRFEQAAWDGLPAQNRSVEDGVRTLQLTDANETGTLRVSEVDVALLLQAKAAIGAGIEILLDQAGIGPSDLGRVCLAGGFGMHLNVAHAIAIGLLPDIRVEQVSVVGNTALAGALLALIDRTTLDEMEKQRRGVGIVELNLADGFEDRYIEHLMLP